MLTAVQKVDVLTYGYELYPAHTTLLSETQRVAVRPHGSDILALNVRVCVCDRRRNFRLDSSQDPRRQ